MDRRPLLSTALLLAVCFLFSWLLFLLLPGIFETWKLQTHDTLFRLRHSLYGPRPIYPSVVHVDFDDRSARAMDRAVMDKPVSTRLIWILYETYVRSIAFDMVFLAGTEGEDDAMLVEATGEAGMVYYPVILDPLDQPGAAGSTTRDSGVGPATEESALWHPRVTGVDRAIPAEVVIASFPELRQAAAGVGHITCAPDRDGVFRRFPLLFRVGDGYVPSLSFRMVCDCLDVDPPDIEVAFGRRILLPGARLPDGREMDISIPIDSEGKIIINFAGPWADSFFHYPIAKVLEAENDLQLLESLTDQLEDNLVVVSDVSTGGRDIGPTPLENIYPLSGLHVNIISSILMRDFLDELPPWAELLVSALLLASLLGLALRLRATVFTVGAVAVLAVFLAASALAFFRFGTLSNIVAPSFAVVLATVGVNVNKYMQEQREKTFITAKLESYFAPDLLSKILKTPGMLEACEEKELTVLFSDIRGFTAWSSTQDPQRIRRTLNAYFEDMAKIVFRHGGTIDKYIGDGLMVFFGDPVEQPDHPLRAVRCAVDMQLATRELKRTWEADEGGLPIQIRIGINTGPVIVGNMGSSRRLDYTTIGANVNLAQRLESGAPPGGILVTRALYDLIVGRVEAEPAGRIKAKGFENEIEVFEILVPGEEAGGDPGRGAAAQGSA